MNIVRKAKENTEMINYRELQYCGYKVYTDKYSVYVQTSQKGVNLLVTDDFIYIERYGEVETRRYSFDSLTLYETIDDLLRKISE